MMDLITRYSGIFAIIVYSLLLWIILAVNGRRKSRTEPVRTAEPPVRAGSPLDENDEDATVAALVAAIEGRNEWHKDVRIVSVREVKA
ncbi:MAG: hypothetical protein IKX74_05320 [Erysipelotrichaceae bacterium]|nr:hypothetical protein [Erysipelotrichaceae bacterium]MBO4537415.1 hypothetical protein [Erysipelotrichaceae bacterium]MBR5049039.1 hypothetical protein [Erysipelotrichaceae bacterium]